MTDKTFNELESKILATEMDKSRQRELLQLVAQLKSEKGEVQKQTLSPLKSPVEELRSSVEGFEQSHPRLVQVVDRISKTLSDLGI